MTAKLIGGRYEIVKLIAEGGMGAVYEAVHTLSRKTIALKVLFPHICKNDDSRQRFLREVSAPAQIGHDGIVEVYDAGIDTSDGTLFVAMELLKGETVREWMLRRHTPQEVVTLFIEILAPLAVAHQKGIVHRDLKPENVFLAKQRDGTTKVKILDFGIARDLDESNANLTQTGIAMGTPHYMAPEQAMSARSASPAADIWALGVMLYEGLTGATPFAGETASAIVVRACTQPHKPLSEAAPHVSPALAELVERSLAKRPEERVQTAGELRQGLQSVLGDGGWGRTPAQPAPWGHAPVGPTQSPSPAAPPVRAQPFTGGPVAAPTRPDAAPSGHAATGQPSQTPFGAPMHHGGQAMTPAATPMQSPMQSPMQPPMQPPMQSPMQPPRPKKKSNGPAIAAAAFACTLLLGVLGIGAFMMMRGDDLGRLQVTTDVVGGELFIDGASFGFATNGQELDVAPGVHSVEVRVGGVVVASQTVTAYVEQPTPVVLVRPLQPDQTVPTPPAQPSHPALVTQGALQAGDSTLQSGELADNHHFTWTSGTRMRVEMRSTEFDTYLIIKSPSNHQLDNDDPSEGVTNAALDVDVNESGQWTVLATTYQAGESGAYELSVQQY